VYVFSFFFAVSEITEDGCRKERENKYKTANMKRVNEHG
jgi:hypothetical protein